MFRFLRGNKKRASQQHRNRKTASKKKTSHLYFLLWKTVSSNTSRRITDDGTFLCRIQ
jgi:hypothetical protein